MPVYYAHHDGVYLTGYSVIRANTEEEARELLDEALRAGGLKDSKTYKWEIKLQKVKPHSAVVIFNGDY